MNRVIENKIVAFADQAIFSKDAILKCLYWYGDKFHVEVSQNDGFYNIVLTPQIEHGISLQELDLYLQKLERDIIDFNLRDIVTKETQNVRDLLIAKAFSNGEYDETPPGDVSDPVGFSIN